MALLAGVGDRPAWLAAILASRSRRLVHMLAGCTMALAATAAVAVAGGAWIGPALSPAAAAILLGMALIAAALGAFWPTRRPSGFDRWPAFPAALTGTFVFAIGDGATFVAFALSARSALPAFAGVGLFAGASVLAVVAATLGERGWIALPRRALAVTGGALLLIGGLAMLGTGLRLI